MLTDPTPPRWESPDPPGIAGTYGDQAIAWAARELGLALGAWQQYVIRKALRHDTAGDLVHRTVLLSTGRQNGKSVVVRVIFGWLLDEGRQLEVFAGWRELLAAAHDAKQARLLYRGVFDDLDSIPRLRKLNRVSSRFDRTVRLTEHFGITLGALTLDTVTGQPGSSRGHSAGAIAWDEVLTQTDWDGYAALLPTQAAQRSAIMLVTSTAGFSESIVLRALFDQLVRQATGAEPADPTFYGAWWQSLDPEPGLDWDAVEQANPALGDGRLTREYIAAEYRRLPPDHFYRERLNHWQERRADPAVNPALWGAARHTRPLEGAEGPFALGVDVAPGAGRATIAVAGVRADGRIGVELYRDLRAPPGGVVTSARIIEAVHAFSDPLVEVLYDSVVSGASAFGRDGADSGLPWRALTPAQMQAACMDVGEMIATGRLAHNDPLLDAQVPAVGLRMVGAEGAFRYSRKASDADIDAFLAAMLAVHSIAYTQRLPQIW